jgi:hypothetical protein
MVLVTAGMGGTGETEAGMAEALLLPGAAMQKRRNVSWKLKTVNIK